MDVEVSPSKASYKASVAQSLFGEEHKDIEEHKILALKNKAPAPRAGYQNHLAVLYSQNLGKSKKEARPMRHIPTTAQRVLDAPGLSDDYYLNLIDWSAHNLIAVALGSSLYLWNASTSTIEELVHFEDEQVEVTGVSFCPHSPSYLSLGLSDGSVQLWDVTRPGAPLRKMMGHDGRVGSLAWNGSILSSGSYDSEIHNHDVRLPQHHVSTFRAHEGEICGLRWSPDGTTLASGGNDNLVHLWSMDAERPRFTLNEHVAAVKALAWCPFQGNLLATGGGTADRTIKFWNTTTGACLSSIDTESQVASLQWARHSKELISSHGFSKNQLCVWRYPSMAKMAELTGHTGRVLHTAISPDGLTVVSAGNEELRFWRAFEAKESSAQQQLTTVKAAAAAKTSARGLRSSMHTIR